MSAVTGYEIRTACDCHKPKVVRFDYQKPTKADPFGGVQFINRVCLTCRAHWFGPVGKVKQFTREAWDRWLEAA